MLVTIQFRRGTAAQWNSVDPVLALGEPGFDTTTLQIKMGDGVSHWTELEWTTPTPEQTAQLLELLENLTDLDDERMTAVLEVETSDFTLGLAALMGAAGNPIGDELRATYVAFTDINGDPLPPGHIVQIRLSADLTQIDDIVTLEA